VGVEPTIDHQGLSLAALPVCVPCRRASPMGFEPMTSTVTGWRALQAAPRGRNPAIQGSGRRSRTFIVRFKAGRPTISRSPSGRRGSRTLKAHRSAVFETAAITHWLALPLRNCGGRNRTCNRLLNREPPYHWATPQKVRTVGFEPTLSGFQNRRICRAFLRPESKHPAGVEPARPAWRAGRLPLHHGCKWDPRDSNPHHAG
jgi:hypothetical protein